MTSPETPPPVGVFDLTGPLPSGTTLLEASAGTGKTHAIAALATRYVAEGTATIDQLLMITFGRSATRELRERVRDTLTLTLASLLGPDPATSADPVVVLLASHPGPGPAARRLADALADFDAATIATTHQFCQRALDGLGVAADVDPGERFAEDIRPLTEQVVEDLYVRAYARRGPTPAALTLADARVIGRAAVADPQSTLDVGPVTPDSADDVRVRFATAVRAEVLARRRAQRVVTFDDLVLRLEVTLTDPVTGPAACQRLRAGYRVVLVDEFQDTDPAQWRIVRTAFHRHRTVVLIGDPKQAIYAFRGADVFSYLDAAATADDRATLPTNWRSDGPVVAGVAELLGDAELGDPRIVVRPVRAGRADSRLSGLPSAARVRLRVVTPAGSGSPPVSEARRLVAADVAADITALLSGPARLAAREDLRGPLVPGNIAVLVSTRRQAEQIRGALAQVAVPAVLAGTTSVFATDAARQWRTLLRALESPRGRTLRPAALTDFVGRTSTDVALAGDALDEEVGTILRRWAGVLARDGMAALSACITAESQLQARLLTRPDGERTLTDLRQLAGALTAQQRATGWGATGLLDWLAEQSRRAADDADQASDRTRRLESDADAVQVLTVHRSKGLEFPVTYLPFGWDRFGQAPSTVRCHEGGRRVLDVRDPASPAVRDHLAAMAAEEAGESLRLLYVGLTRAASLVVAHWSPSARNTEGAPLHRLLWARASGQTSPERRYGTGTPPLDWLAGSAHVDVETVPAEPSPTPWTPDVTGPVGLAAARYDRVVDTTWRRTSYTGLTSGLHGAPEQAPPDHRADEPDEEQAVESVGASTGEPTAVGAGEPTTGPQGVRPTGVPAGAPAPVRDNGSWDAPGDALASPFADLPAGAAFGTLVHAVLEQVDTDAPDLAAEVAAQCAQALARRPFPGVEAGSLARALTAALITPLGPLAAGRRLADVPARDRLPELDFEFPLHEGPGAANLGDVAALLRAHLPSADPLARYSEALGSQPLASSPLAGYLSGSIDAVLRVDVGPSPGQASPVYLVVDYKTNLLRDPNAPGVERLVRGYRPAVLPAAMIGAHYPLQALLYSVALHRYLRWRLPGYDPRRDLGGVLYLFLRGMAGPATPTEAGVPCGVLSWRPPAALVTDLSDLLDGPRP